MDINIDKAFEGRWRYKGYSDESIKGICRDFFEAGVLLAIDGTTVSPQGFEEFWDLYDKKVGKPKCIKLWAKLTAREKEECMAHVPLYRQAQPNKQYRKNPETYLRNKSWHDEIIDGNNTLTADQRRQQRLNEAARAIASYAEADNGIM